MIASSKSDVDANPLTQEVRRRTSEAIELTNEMKAEGSKSPALLKPSSSNLIGREAQSHKKSSSLTVVTSERPVRMKSSKLFCEFSCFYAGKALNICCNFGIEKLFFRSVKF